MVIRAAGEDRLVAQVFTRFTDNSGRTNYTGVYTFVRGSVTGQSGPAAPTPVSPVNGAVFDHFPRTTTLAWRALPGAVSYVVEVDYFSNGWYRFKLVSNVTTTSFTFEFVGAQPGRWRVWAVDSNGQESAKTDWLEFRYTR
jgi:hypothetical protein